MTKYHSPRHHYRFVLGLAVASSFASNIALADTDLTKAYSALNCESDSDKERLKTTTGYRAEQGQYVVCPIDRDGTEVDGLPRVVVEAYNNAQESSGELMCSVFWRKEDSDGGIRGQTSFKTATVRGAVQFLFDADDYRADASLTPGGEGTMGVFCTDMNEGDRLIQYQVTENLY
jgi:hypothetical protein